MVFFAGWDMTTGRVGPPIACSEIKLISWEEGEEIICCELVNSSDTKYFANFDRMDGFKDGWM